MKKLSIVVDKRLFVADEPLIVADKRFFVVDEVLIVAEI
jgi:hypothetical protein